MKSFLALIAAAFLGLVAVGCDSQTASKKTETTVETPSGSTTTTSETKVEATGDHKAEPAKP
jgi:hypothetical protein